MTRGLLASRSSATNHRYVRKLEVFLAFSEIELKRIEGVVALTQMSDEPSHEADPIASSRSLGVITKNAIRRSGSRSLRRTAHPQTSGCSPMAPLWRRRNMGPSVQGRGTFLAYACSIAVLS